MYFASYSFRLIFASQSILSTVRENSQPNSDAITCASSIFSSSLPSSNLRVSSKRSACFTLNSRLTRCSSNFRCPHKVNTAPKEALSKATNALDMSILSPFSANAQSNCQKRANTVSAHHIKHQTQRKLKVPHVFGLFELFVRCELHPILNIPI
ncbi:hypothetical protein VIBNIMADA3020_270002 [Vibrio nigripulchritudo MADA3020]|nr:hypothetical protein VIBNIMADA3020_270002 [Vibrio nigripulchritudo MADA3020]CCN53246.1 hypothetical protein VIBNIMADA3021_270002 [Vibrio nigripulchritudo MADA3021]